MIRSTPLERALQCTAGSQRFGLYLVYETEAGETASEVIDDDRRSVPQRHDHARKTIGCEHCQQYFEKGLAANGGHRFRQIGDNGAQTGTESSRKDDRLPHFDAPKIV